MTFEIIRVIVIEPIRYQICLMDLRNMNTVYLGNVLHCFLLSKLW